MDLYDLNPEEVRVIRDALLSAHSELVAISLDPLRNLYTPDFAKSADDAARRCKSVIRKISGAL